MYAYLFIIFSIFFFPLQSYSSYDLPLTRQTSTEARAKSWSALIIKNCSSATAKKISELLYWSHKRSQSTLATQAAGYTLLEANWAAYRTCTATRLNPAYIDQYKVDPVKFMAAHTNFMTTQQDCLETQRNYLAIVKELIEDTPQKYALIADELESMRSTARTIVAQALLKELPRLRQLVAEAQKLVSHGAHQFQEQPPLKSPDIEQEDQVKLLHHLWQYIPSLMIKSFVKFDHEFHDISNTCFYAFLESQRASNAFWEIIEESRADFYATHQRIFDATLIEHGLNPYVAH